MSPQDRRAALKTFDEPDQLSKKRMFTCGEETANQFLLHSLTLVEKFKYRYLTPSRRLPAEKAETWGRELTALDTHEWMVTTIRTALQNPTWMACEDPGEAQKVAVQEPSRLKRKSDLTEYADSVEKRGRQAEP